MFKKATNLLSTQPTKAATAIEILIILGLVLIITAIALLSIYPIKITIPAKIQDHNKLILDQRYISIIGNQKNLYIKSGTETIPVQYFYHRLTKNNLIELFLFPGSKIANQNPGHPIRIVLDEIPFYRLLLSKREIFSKSSR